MFLHVSSNTAVDGHTRSRHCDPCVSHQAEASKPKSEAQKRAEAAAAAAAAAAAEQAAAAQRAVEEQAGDCAAVTDSRMF